MLADRGIEVIASVDVTKSSGNVNDGSNGGGENKEGCEARIRAALRGRPVSLALFNAAVMSVERDLISGEGFDEEASRRQYESNALGFLRAAAALAPALVERARSSIPPSSPPERDPTPKLVLVSSKMASLGRLAEAPGGGMYGYRASKAAANAVALSLSRDLLRHGVAVGMVHPGTVATDMYREYHGGGGSKELVPSAGLSSPEAAAEMVLRVIEEKVGLERTGVFWNEAGEVLPY
jgi:NAD(P)-dependent dehydrogenase (short-subunit alcohol dehydrogenase family)